MGVGEVFRRTGAIRVCRSWARGRWKLQEIFLPPIPVIVNKKERIANSQGQIEDGGRAVAPSRCSTSDHNVRVLMGVLTKITQDNPTSLNTIIPPAL